MTKCDIILKTVTMQLLLNKYGIVGERGKYICPFHNDKHPSGCVCKKDYWFKCYACGVAYNVIDFVAHYENCSRKLAIAKIDKMFKLGLDSELTKEQIAEIENASKKLERERLRKKFALRDERMVLSEIISELRFWENVQKTCHPTRGEVRNGTWELGDLFFLSFKKQSWLEWLYNAICEVKHIDCEYDYIFGNNKEELVNKVCRGEIEI